MLKLLIFFVINFGALGLGSVLIGNPGTNEWYQNVNKAPWTPPGWVFGAAWTSIMVCFSLFMYKASFVGSYPNMRMFYFIFAIQWLLNVIWNPLFFRYHMVLVALLVILLLTAIVFWFLFWGIKHIGIQGLLVLPYAVWLCIAISLNAYIYFKN